MKEFCSKCAELEAQIEVLTRKHFDEMQCLKQKLQESRSYADKLQSENEALSLDVAYYNKDFKLTPHEDLK